MLEVVLQTEETSSTGEPTKRVVKILNSTYDKDGLDEVT